ncbi:hypothetical protein FOMPIDRAFT_1046695 [Fomitopsis schrenkii]|uniref:HIG1 domain-containing protein n=1 Tax=Fomitopsis schrenkii TaxID=2126942 RepID=S8EJZ1_FOMSC|nr:hypothetical protein FOMPIDRAFT_1046695 [Fomitopsis schrenkii]
MKIVSEEERNAQMRATVVGGAKGFGGGLAFALPVSYLLNQRWPYYRQLPPSLKAFGVILVAVPAFVINAEHGGLKYEKEHWTDVGAHELDILKHREQVRWDKMSPLEKLKDTAGRHEYGFIGGAWAATMVGAFGWIMRDKYQTMPQKIVQARMWAQGLTIGILIAAGALTHARRQQALDEHGLRHIEPDHSWRDIVEQTSKENEGQERT